MTYCTECGEEISRENFKTGYGDHDIRFFARVEPTSTEDGMEEHYECTVCGKCFRDATGSVEVDREELIIKAEHVRGDADGNGELAIDDVTTIQRYLVELPVTDNWDAIAADADKDEEIDIIDVSLIQRVLANMTTFDAWDAKHAKS